MAPFRHGKSNEHGRGPGKVPRVRDRSGSGESLSLGAPATLYAPLESLEALVPWLSLKGGSTGDVSEALQALLGPDAPGLSPATLAG